MKLLHIGKHHKINDPIFQNLSNYTSILFSVSLPNQIRDGHHHDNDIANEKLVHMVLSKLMKNSILRL